MITVALIGHGYWGSILDRYIKGNPNFNLKYVCNSKSDLNDVWKDDCVGAVVVATRNEQRFPIVEQALQKRKHVLTEKPLAMTTKEARYLADLAKSKKVTLSVDYTFTVSKSLQLAQKLMRNGRIGYLLGYDMRVGHLAPFGGGSVYWILGSHCLSVLAMFIDLEPLDFIRHDLVTYNKEVETGIIVSDGVTGQIHLSLNYLEKEAEFVFYGERGTIVYNPNKHDSLIIENYERKTWVKGDDLPHKREIICNDESNNLKYVFEYFYDVITGKACSNTETAVKITEILEKLHGNPETN